MIRRLFTDIAAIYDRMNHVLSLGLDRRWRRLAAADVKGTPTRVLDLACGTGEVKDTCGRPLHVRRRQSAPTAIQPQRQDVVHADRKSVV